MNHNTRSIFLFAGEQSGDMYGGRLIKALKETGVHKFQGVGGVEMRHQGLEVVLPTENFSVMGFSDVLPALPRLWLHFRKILKQILHTKPDAVVFIDSPSFSLRMAKALRKANYSGKIIQYISPTVWAWGKQRIVQMEQRFDLLLTIYPFESGYFKNSSLKTVYVGHPLQEIINEHPYSPHWKKLCGINETNHLVALFPGSRPAEIKRNLPKQVEAVKLLKRAFPSISFAISSAGEKNALLIKKILKTSDASDLEFCMIPKEYRYELMQDCCGAIAKSGTVTLELALHQCPTVVSYELTALNKFAAKYFLKLKLPHYCIVNILSDKRIYPELIGKPFSSHDLCNAFKPLYENGEKREQCLQECAAIDSILGSGQASRKAAQSIIEVIDSNRN